MKLSKLILITVAATFLLTSISANAATISREHRTFKGNGTPASEALAKKCQTIWDEFEELGYQRDVLRVKAHNGSNDKKISDITEKRRVLRNELNKNRCL